LLNRATEPAEVCWWELRSVRRLALTSTSQVFAERECRITARAV